MHLSPECPAEMAPDDGTDLIEAVVTCEGNLHDPDFNDRFQILLGNLKSILYKPKEEEKIKVKKVEPWNSVRVTISIPKEAAQKLRLLAQQGSNVLKSLGILTVQLQGDQVISLTLAGQNNSPSTELVLRQSSSDGSGSSSSSSFPFHLPIGAPTGPSSLVPGPSLSSTSNPPSSSSSAFRSPNVVAPTGETIPVLPPPPPPSTKGAGPLGPRGPFPFASMTHAAQTMQRTDNNLNSQLPSQQQVPPSTTTPSSPSPVAAAGSSSAPLSSTSTVKSNNNNNNLIHNAVNSTNFPVVSSPQLTHQQSSLIIGQQQQQQQQVTVTNSANKSSSEQVSRFVLQPQQQTQQQQQQQLLQKQNQQQQQTNLLYQQQSQSLQLQIVNVNAPPPYPGVNISSSNSVSGVVNVTGQCGQGSVVSVSNLSSSSHPAGNINLLGSSNNTINFVGSNNNNNSNNVLHHHHQQQQQQLLNSSILSSGGGGTITSSASLVCVGASSSSSNASNSNLTLVRSVSTPSMMTSQQLDDLLGGSSNQQPMCSPLLVNLLQNNDAQSSNQSGSSSSDPLQQQPQQQPSGQTSVELQKQRFILQQQHLQQLQQRKMKRVMSLDGASPEIGTLVRPSGGSGPASPAVAVSASGDGSSALLLPSRMSGPVNVGQPRLSSDLATTATIIQGRTIIHQGNVRVFNPGQIRAIRLGHTNPTVTTSSIQFVQGKPTSLSAGASQQLQQHLLQQQKLQTSDLVLSNGPVHISNHQMGSSGIDKSHMDQSAPALNPSSRTFISTSSASSSKQFIPISTSSSNVALNQQQQKLGSQVAGGRNVQSEITKVGPPTPAAPTTPSQSTTAHNRNKPPKELTSSGKPRQLLINPLTGHLEPMPSESSSDGSDEEGSKVGRLQHNNNLKKTKGAGGSKRPPVSKNFANSKGGGVIQHRQHVTTTTTGVTVARVVKSTPESVKSGGQSKDKSAANTSTVGSSHNKRDKSAEAGEKIKLRLKLEKKEPISPAYKVDVSFVKKSEKVGSSGLSSSSVGSVGIPGGSNSPSGSLENPGEAQPRVPPLHISLRGKNAAVVVQSSPARSSSVDEDSVNYSGGSFSLGAGDSLKGSGGKSGKRTNKRVRSSGGIGGDDVPSKISRPRLSKDGDEGDGLKGRLMVSMTKSAGAGGGSQVDSNKVSITAVQVVSKDLTFSSSGDNCGAPVPSSLPGPAVKLKTEDAKMQEKQTPSLPTPTQPPTSSPATSVLQASSLSLLYQHLSKKEDKPVIATTSSLTSAAAVTVTTTTRTATMNPPLTTTTSVLTLTSTSTGIGASVMTTLSSDVSVSSATSTTTCATLSASASSLQEEVDVKLTKEDCSSLLPPPPPLAIAATPPATTFAAGPSLTKNIPKLIRENKPKELDLSSVSAPISVIPSSPGGRSTPTSKSPKPLPDLLALTSPLPPVPIIKRSSSESPTKEVALKSPTPPLIPVHLNQVLTQSALPSPIPKNSLLIPSSPSTTSLVPQVKGSVPSNTATTAAPPPQPSGAKGFTAQVNLAEVPILSGTVVPENHLGATVVPKSVLDNRITKLVTKSLPSAVLSTPTQNKEEESTETVKQVLATTDEPSRLAETVKECKPAADEPEKVSLIPSISEIPLVDDVQVKISTAAVVEPIEDLSRVAKDTHKIVKNEMKNNSDNVLQDETKSETVDASLDEKLQPIVQKEEAVLELTCVSQPVTSNITANSVEQISSEIPSVLELPGKVDEPSLNSENVLFVEKSEAITALELHKTVLPVEPSSQSSSDAGVADSLVDPKHSETKVDVELDNNAKIVDKIDTNIPIQQAASSNTSSSFVQSVVGEGNTSTVKVTDSVLENDKVTEPANKPTHENTQSSKVTLEAEAKTSPTKEKSSLGSKHSSFEDKKTSRKFDRAQNSLSSKVSGVVKMKSNNQRLKGQVSKPKVSIGTSIDADLPILTPAPSLRELLEKEKERSGLSESPVDSQGSLRKFPSNLPSMSKIDAVIERAIQESKEEEKPEMIGKCIVNDTITLDEQDLLQTCTLKPEVVEPPILSTIIPNAPLPFPLILPKPPEDPNGGHGEDSGIDSMDALSEKSPNQGESPARKEIEQFIVDTKDECNYELAKPTVVEISSANAAGTAERAPVDWISKTDEKCVLPDGQLNLKETQELVPPQEIQTDVPSILKDETVGSLGSEDIIQAKIPSEEASAAVQESKEPEPLDNVAPEVTTQDNQVEKTSEVETEEESNLESIKETPPSVTTNTDDCAPVGIKMEPTPSVANETKDSDSLPMQEQKQETVHVVINETTTNVKTEEPAETPSQQAKTLPEPELVEPLEVNCSAIKEPIKEESDASVSEVADESKMVAVNHEDNAVNPEDNSETSAKIQGHPVDAIQELNDQALKKEVKKEIVTTPSRLVNAKVRKSKLENIVALIGTKNIERQMQAKTELESPCDTVGAVVKIDEQNSVEHKLETESDSSDSPNNRLLDSSRNCGMDSNESTVLPIIAKKSLPQPIDLTPPIEKEIKISEELPKINSSDPPESTASSKKVEPKTEKLQTLNSSSESSATELPLPLPNQITSVVKQVVPSLKPSEPPPISIVLPASTTSPQKPILEPQVKTKVRSRPKVGSGSPVPRRGGDGPPKLSKATETDPRPESANPPRLEMPTAEKERHSPPNLQLHNVIVPQSQSNPAQIQCNIVPTTLAAVNQLPAVTRALLNHANVKTQIHSVPPTPQQLQHGMKALQNVLQISRSSPIHLSGSLVNKISISGSVASVSNSISSISSTTHIPVSLAAIANAVHHATATATTGICNTTTTSPGQTLFAIHPNMTNLPANLSHLQGHHGTSSITAMLPGGQKMVPVKLVTIPRQTSGPFQTIPLSGIGNASRASPNLLEAVNIVANAGNSRSNSPKTIQFHPGQGGTGQINLSSIQSLAGGGNLHLVPISMASGSSNPVKVLVSSPIKMPHQSLHHQPMQLMKSVMVGQQATTIRVVRPIDAPANSIVTPAVSNSISIPPATVTTKQITSTTPPPAQPKLTATVTAGDVRIGQQLQLATTPANTTLTTHMANSNPVSSPVVTPVDPPKQSENPQPFNSPKVSPVALQPEVARTKQATPIPEHIYKHVDELEVLDDSGQNEEDDLPYEADIIHDEKDLEDVLAGCEVVEENGIDYNSDLLEPEPNIKSKAILVNCTSNSTPVGSYSHTSSHGNVVKSSKPRSRSPSPQSDVHGEDQEIIDSFTRSPSQPKLSPQNKPIEEREESPTKPDLTEVGKRLDEELSIEIPPVDLMVGSPSQGTGSGRKDHSDSGGERKSTRSTRSNTRLVSPDITAFRSDTPKPSKFTAKVDPLILRNSPKPSPTGSLKLLSPSTSTSVLAVTPSSSNRSSPVNHVVGSVSSIIGASVSLSSSIDKISGSKKVGKRKRQESDSSSCTSENATGTEEKTSEIDLNSRPGKRRCSENAAELIKVQIGVEDTPKRNAMLTKRLEESNKLKEAKLKKKEAMATVVEENEDDTESIESSLSSRGRGRSSRGSSEDRSSSRGSSVQRSGSVAKSITNDEPKVKTKNRLNQKEQHKTSERDSPNQNVVKRKLKDGVKKGTKRPVRRGIAKEKSPLVPSKARTIVRKDQMQGQILGNITSTPVAGEKMNPGVPTGSSGAETENSRRKTRSSAASKRLNHVSVDTSDSDGAMKRRRISKDTKS